MGTAVFEVGPYAEREQTYTMQHVAQKWLRWFQLGLILTDVGLGLIFTLMHYGHFSPSTQALWGNNPLILVVCGIHIVYCAAAYYFFEKHYTWIAHALSVAIFAINVAVILEITGNRNFAYQALYIILSFFFAMLGPLLPISAGALVFVLFFFTLLGVSHDSGLALGVPITLALDFAAVGMSFLGWRVFRTHYSETDTAGMERLAGLLKSKEPLSDILIQSIADAIIVTDVEGKVTLLNPAAAKMTGWQGDEAIGIDVKLVVNLSQEDGKELTEEEYPFTRLFKTSQPTNDTLQLTDRSKEGHYYISLVISPMIEAKTNSIIGSVAVFRDVSAARQEEHRRADFISTASHEMRTPVAAIEGYLALALNDKVSRIDSKARGFLVKAHESTQRLGKLFQDLLTSAKAEDGRLVNHPVPIEFGEYLEKMVDGLRFAAEKKGLLLDFVMGGGQQESSISTQHIKMVKPLYYAHIDPDRMQEVITNLFDNAVKYTESGKITIGLTGNNDVIQFFIKDSGHGIPAEDIPHLFQKFYRVDNSSTRTIGGTGLGLFICRKIVELYHGRIWVESEVGKGSTFYINIPRLTPQKAQELQTIEAQKLTP